MSDFGAASFWPEDLSKEHLMRLEVLAWGRLIIEIVERCDHVKAGSGLLALCQACTSPIVCNRPSMVEALSELRTLL